MKNKPKVVEIMGTSVSRRSKWDNERRKKLNARTYVARLIFRDETGAKREFTREFARRVDAEDHLRQEKQKFARSAGRELDAANMTFGDLAAHYLRDYATVAQYAEGRKITGLRSLSAVQGYVEMLSRRFGNRRLNTIRYADLRDLRLERLKTPVVRRVKIKIPLTTEERKLLCTRKKSRMEYIEKSSSRKIASVNRELMTLRRMLNVAVTEGWIPSSPFKAGPPIIDTASEAHRTRILTKDEEERLLAACDCDQRRHLKSLIVCLLDTGLRCNEALTLAWENVDFERNLLHVLAVNSKTATPRSVAISSRLKIELVRLLTEAKFLKNPSELQRKRVFGISNNVKRSWKTAKNLAGLDDLRLHDLRHTFGTRLDSAGFTQAQIARSLGHKQVHTTYRYTNPTSEHHDKVRATIDDLNAR